MSVEATPLYVLTVPSNFLSYNPSEAHESYCDRSYSRIVGIEDTDGSMAWADPRPDIDFRGLYTPDQVQEATLSLDSALHERLRAFFDRFFVKGHLDEVNCHVFGVTMFDLDESQEQPNVNRANWRMRALLQRSTEVIDVRPGKLGIVGLTDSFLAIRQPIHSFVRVADGESTLQVTGVGGHLGILTLTETLQVYGRQATQVLYGVSEEDIKLYSPPVATT